MNIKKVKEIVNWMYSKDNPNRENHLKWSKKIILAHVLKQNKDNKK